MGYTHLEPGIELEIVTRTYGSSGENDISELVKFPPDALAEQEQASIEKEKIVYDKMLNTGQEWLRQAHETAALRKALAYLRTMPVSHTSNQWKEKEYGWHEMSNMVYKFTYRISENTHWDRAAQKNVTTSWELSWYLTYNADHKTSYYDTGRQIAGQTQKRFRTREDMDKYLQGRIKAHAHLFTEVSPPIPADQVKRFCVHGVLLPGYTVERSMEPDKETVDDLLSLLDDDDISNASETVQGAKLQSEQDGPAARPVSQPKNKPAAKRPGQKKKPMAPTR